MKLASILIASLLLAFPIFSQTTETMPDYQYDSRNNLVQSDLLVNQANTVPEWSSTFEIGRAWGGIGIHFQVDTTNSSDAAANVSDSCMTIYLQTRPDRESNWFDYAFRRSAATYTKLDTVDRALCNVGGAYMSFSLSGYNGWIPGGQFRIGFQIGTGDYTYIKKLWITKF